MNDAWVKMFLELHKSRLRSSGALENLGSEVEYFALEMERDTSGQMIYLLRWSASERGDPGKFTIEPSVLAKILRGPSPFIPKILTHIKQIELATRSEALCPSNKSPSFIYDALLLGYVSLFVQFDWKDAKVPDGFKLGVRFEGETKATYHPLHNDMVATAVEKRESVLKTILQLCPALLKRIAPFEPQLLSKWEADELRGDLVMSQVLGHDVHDVWL